MSQTLHYIHDFRLPNLVTELEAAGIPPIDVYGDGTALTIVVPDTVRQASIDPVVAAHDVAAIDAAALAQLG